MQASSTKEPKTSKVAQFPDTKQVRAYAQISGQQNRCKRVQVLCIKGDCAIDIMTAYSRQLIPAECFLQE